MRLPSGEKATLSIWALVLGCWAASTMETGAPMPSALYTLSTKLPPGMSRPEMAIWAPLGETATALMALEQCGTR